MVYVVPKPVSLGRRSVQCGERERGGYGLIHCDFIASVSVG